MPFDQNYANVRCRTKVPKRNDWPIPGYVGDHPRKAKAQGEHSQPVQVRSFQHLFSLYWFNVPYGSFALLLLSADTA